MGKLIQPFLLIAILFFGACKTPRFVYSPSPPNNPYFIGKGQSKFTAYYSSGGDDNAQADEKNNGFDLQAAYAISKNWALTASYFNRKERDTYTGNNNFFNTSEINYKRKLAEFGGGYFVPLNKRKSIFFDIYGGLGFGKFSFTDAGKDKNGADYTRLHSTNVTKFFFQPAFYFILGKYFRFSLIEKFSFVKYRHISTSYTNDELQYLDLSRLPGSTLNFSEPTFNMQIGVPECDWLKIDGGFTIASGPFSNTSNIRARNFNASIGLSFDFSKIKK